MFCKQSLGKINFRAFLKHVGPRILSFDLALITLEQVNMTTEWSEKNQVL